MRSMTGCGRGQSLGEAWEVTAEIKTVNHRFLDVACRLPRSLSFLEEGIRKRLGGSIRRGHADVFLTVRRVNGAAATVQVDEALACCYSEAAARLAEATGCAMDVTVSTLLGLEGVVQTVEAEVDEEAVSALCAQALDEALTQLNDMRCREGEHLMRDLAEHLDAAQALRERIALRAPQVVEDYRARLQSRLAAMGAEGIDPARLVQEVALMADRCAIDEELSRLNSHIAQMRTYLAATGEIGKKMDFLIQEMNREANTIGSKASDARIAQDVVDLKSEIEKLREQVQNVE